MSFQAMNWAVQQRTGGPGIKAVLLAMANYADEDGFCFPSQERLAYDTEQGERTVRRHIADLVAMGLLEKRVRGGSGTGRWNNVYRLVMEQPANLAARATGQIEHGNRPLLAGEPPLEEPPLDVDPGASDQIPLDIPASLESNHLPARTRDTRTSNGAQLDSEFETFWAAYPRKTGKLAARRAYATARKRADADAIHAGAVRYAGLRSGQDPTFTKHPSTWLNGGCWMDEPSAAATATAAAPVVPHKPWVYRDEHYWSTP